MIDDLDELELRTEGPLPPPKKRRGILQVKVSDDLHEEVREIAAINGIAMGVVISKLLSYGLAKLPEFPDLPDDGRFVGTTAMGHMKRYVLEPGILENLQSKIKKGYSITYVANKALAKGLAIAKENSRKRQYMDSRPVAAWWDKGLALSDGKGKP